MSINVTIPVKMGEHHIMDWEAGAARPFNVLLLCPKCSLSSHLGKYDNEDEYGYEDEDTIKCEHTLMCQSIDEYNQHIEDCDSPFTKGINKVDSQSTPVEYQFVVDFAKWSRRDAEWDFPLVGKQDLETGKTIAFVYVNEVGPVSYIAFQSQQFKFKPIKGEAFVLWDMYTYPKFRRNGIATELINCGIDDLRVDRSYIPVSYPWNEKSKGIIKNLSSDKVLAVTGGPNCYLYDKDDFD